MRADPVKIVKPTIFTSCTCLSSANPLTLPVSANQKVQLGVVTMKIKIN